MLPVDLATFTEKMFNEKFHFLCSGCSRGNELKNVQAYQVFAVFTGLGWCLNQMFLTTLVNNPVAFAVRFVTCVWPFKDAICYRAKVSWLTFEKVNKFRIKAYFEKNSAMDKFTLWFCNELHYLLRWGQA